MLYVVTWFFAFQVGWLTAKGQTILALHHRVITHNSRIDVDHDGNRYDLKQSSIFFNRFHNKYRPFAAYEQILCFDFLSGYGN